MSLELTVYTRLPEVCEIPRLAARLREPGWEVRVLNEYSRTAEVLQQAECHYELSAWAMDNRQSEQLLRDVAWALAKETGGIIFDTERVHAAWAEEMARGEPVPERLEGHL